MEDINTIIWDWNGTLLDDVDICIDIINELLSIRNQQPLTRSRYREIFTFPVKDYYSKAGFDFTQEPFDKIPVVDKEDTFHTQLRSHCQIPSCHQLCLGGEEVRGTSE